MCLLYSNDENALKNVLENDKVYENIDRETAELISDVTESNLKFEEGKEKVNMCKATEDMKKEAVKANNIEIAKALLHRGRDSVEEIASLTKLSVEEINNLSDTVIN